MKTKLIIATLICATIIAVTAIIANIDTRTEIEKQQDYLLELAQTKGIFSEEYGDAVGEYIANFMAGSENIKKRESLFGEFDTPKKADKILFQLSPNESKRLGILLSVLLGLPVLIIICKKLNLIA